MCFFLDAVRKRYQGATDKVINDQITAFFSTAGDRENGREERRQRAKSRKDEINENLLQSQSEAQNSAPPTEDQHLLLQPQPQSIFNFDLSSSEESE